MAKKKVQTYEERNYDQSKNIHDCMAQAVQDIKYDTSNPGGRWNLPVEQIQGMTFRLIEDNKIEFVCHHFENTTIRQLAISEDVDKRTIREFVKEFKKRFKELAHKVLELKELRTDRTIEKTGYIRAETAWSPDSNYGQFLVRDVIVYEYDPELLK